MSQQNERTLICGLCQQSFDLGSRLPRVIPDCGHTFCEDCIFHQIVQSQQTFRCPHDQQLVLCKRETIADFPKNISITNILQQFLPKQISIYESPSIQPQQRPSTLAEVLSQPSYLLKLEQSKISSSTMFGDKNSSDIIPQNPLQNYQTMPTFSQTLCEEHIKNKELACMDCQMKICSHCAIFGDHKGHQVLPEDQVKIKSEQGIEEMMRIKGKIQLTREGFFSKMEDNFRQLICSRINQKKDQFKESARLKYTEIIKAVELQAQKSAGEIDVFFGQIEEKFRKFKNYNFTETFEKILSFNQMVDDTKIATEFLRNKSELNFDLFFNLERLITSGNEIDQEYNNLIAFPVKLVGEYLENLILNIEEQQIIGNIQNCMSLLFIEEESEVIKKSIQHLTVDNQREILNNAQFLQLTPSEIKRILGNLPEQTTLKSTSEAYFQSQRLINSKITQKTQQIEEIQQQQPQQLRLDNNTNNNISVDSRSSSSQRSGLIGSKIGVKNDVNLENVGLIVAELRNSQKGQEANFGLNKDKMLNTNIDTQAEFIKHTPFNLNSSLYNSFVQNNNNNNALNIQNDSQIEQQQQQQIQQNPAVMFTPSSSSKDNYINSNIIQKSQNSRSVCGTYTESPRLCLTPNHRSVYYPSKVQNSFNLEPKSPYLKQQDQIKNSKQYLSTTSKYESGDRSSSSTNNSFNRSARNLNSNNNYASTYSSSNIKSQLNISTNERQKTTPQKNNNIQYITTVSQLDQSNIIPQNNNFNNNNNSNNYSSNPTQQQQQQLKTSTISANTTTGDTGFDNNQFTMVSAILNSKNNSLLKLVKPSNRLFKQNGLELGSSNISQTARGAEKTKTPPRTPKKQSNNPGYKKKSDKLMNLLQRLKTQQFIDTIELVNEDINDSECAELSQEIAKYEGNIESIKLVKNKITNIGLKVLFEGLQQSNQKIHTFNLTSNLCNENCLGDVLNYLHVNDNCKNVYLVHNCVSVNKNDPVLREIQHICNLHI